MKHDISTLLAELRGLWRQERQATQEQFAAERRDLSLAERIERGLAIKDLAIEETGYAPGQRVTLWIAPRKETDLDDLRLGPGEPVRLWWDDPDEADATLGVVTRRRGRQFGVMVDADYSERLEDGGFRLDRDAPVQTFVRGDRALDGFGRLKRGEPLAELRDVLFGLREAEFDSEAELSWFDGELNGPQREAVARALAARQLALIHGPPGTGKTRTLIEVIRQAVARGDRVLATAASNTAVDNLAERLVAAGVSVVRLGHPARVAEAVEDHSLDALLEATSASKLARKWIDEANRLRTRTERQWARRTITWDERRLARQEVGRLMRDARQHVAGTRDAIIERADVICATATGADTSLLGDRTFDLVVLDEATQAVDPVTLIALTRARRAVLAGDPRQLPPTVISAEAARAGLGRTFFERLEASGGAHLVRMLRVQHRMHADLMAFPSASMYGNKLEAESGVAGRTLDDLGAAHDHGRPGPLVFVDTAGKGWEELRTADDPSTRNVEQGARTVAEVRRLLSRGVEPGAIGVITPYAAQVRLLRHALMAERALGLEVHSVDGFQGREKEAIIVDLVRSNEDGEIGFLGDTRRMNVALTRAKRWLLVVGDSATIGNHPYYKEFLEYAELMDATVSAWVDDGEPL